MRHRTKNGLGLLIAAALGLMAFATSAHAITDVLESGFYINEAPVGALKASVAASQVGRGTLLIPALKVEVNCEKFSLTEGFVNTTTDAKGKLLYEECTVLTNEGAKLEEAFGCEIVANHTGDNKHHITATALLLPAELKDNAAGKEEGLLAPAILIEKIEASVLTKPETGCVLPKTTVIKGELCVKIVNNHAVEVELEASEAIQKLCKPRLELEGLGKEIFGTEAEILELENAVPPKAFLDKLLFGINEAFVDGKVKVKLTGEHAGKKLGVLLI